MQIKIPLTLVRMSSCFGDWMNRPVWRKSKFDFRYVDAWTAVGFLVCVGGYWWMAGAFGALQGALLYILVAMIALWFL